MGKTHCDGRKTFESIVKPLPGRRTIVDQSWCALSKQKDWCLWLLGSAIFSSVSDICLVKSSKESWWLVVLRFYQLALTVLNVLVYSLWTPIKKANAFFPEVDWPVLSYLMGRGCLRQKGLSIHYRFLGISKNQRRVIRMWPTKFEDQLPRRCVVVFIWSPIKLRPLTKILSPVFLLVLLNVQLPLHYFRVLKQLRKTQIFSKTPTGCVHFFSYWCQKIQPYLWHVKMKEVNDMPAHIKGQVLLGSIFTIPIRDKKDVYLGVLAGRYFGGEHRTNGGVRCLFWPCRANLVNEGKYNRRVTMRPTDEHVACFFRL